MNLDILSTMRIKVLFIIAILLIANLCYASNYSLQEVTSSSTWDGTNGSRLQSTSTYGDETIVRYSLPWPFKFYGQPYNSIAADSNGNIWFASNITTSAHSFSLSSTGRGPVIAAWNDDLSSSYLGGVFIQHKSDAPLGDRVTIEWKTETQSEEGLFVPNSFETILFPDGKIRVDYKSITTALGYDSGSGISNGDAVSPSIQSITANYSSVPTLTATGQRSFLFVPPLKLQVNFAGTGTGTVTVTAPSISPMGCSTNCSADLNLNDSVTLSPGALEYSLFTKWTSGPCIDGTGDCNFTMVADTTATAQFDRDTQHEVLIGTGGSGTYYSTIQAAYNAAAPGETIKLWGTLYAENVTCGINKTITFQGGYNSGYTAITGMTTLQGVLTIGNGMIIADGLAIR